ncbi:MAG: ankyrin repeat domain-containing protein [Truepera sp.]|nr:ankyrin repeat domain-containing protein [Truepera sp.]
MGLRYLLVAVSVLALVPSCAPPGTQESAVDCGSSPGARGRPRPGWYTYPWEFFASATLAEVRGCLEAGARVNARNSWGTTPLHWAAGYSGDPAIITTLLAAGAEVNAQDRDGDTPLHFAARFSDDPAVLRALLAAGAEVNARDEDGYTPLHLAAKWSDNPAVIEVLLASGADPSAWDYEGKIPWDYAKDRAELNFGFLLRN